MATMNLTGLSIAPLNPSNVPQGTKRTPGGGYLTPDGQLYTSSGAPIVLVTDDGRTLGTNDPAAKGASGYLYATDTGSKVGNVGHAFKQFAKDAAKTAAIVGGAYGVGALSAGAAGAGSSAAAGTTGATTDGTAAGTTAAGTTAGATTTGTLLPKLVKGAQDASQVLSAISAGRAAGRGAEASVDQSVNQANVEAANAGNNQILADVNQRKYLDGLYQQQIKNAVIAKLLGGGLKDVSFSNLPAGVTPGQVNGGLRPSAFGDTSAIAADLTKNAMPELDNPMQPGGISGITNEPNSLPSIPKLPTVLTPPTASGLDTGLNVGATGLALLPSIISMFQQNQTSQPGQPTTLPKIRPTQNTTPMGFQGVNFYGS